MWHALKIAGILMMTVSSFLTFSARAETNAGADQGHQLLRLEKKIGRDWVVEKISEGYLLTYAKPVVFYTAHPSSSKVGRHEQLARGRNGQLRIKVVLGPSLGRIINEIERDEYEIYNDSNFEVRPEIEAQRKQDYFLCYDALWQSDKQQTVYFFSNVKPGDDIYVADQVGNNTRLDDYDPCLYVLGCLCDIFSFKPNPLYIIQD